MTASKAATIIRIMSSPDFRDPRFISSVTEKIDRGTKI